MTVLHVISPSVFLSPMQFLNQKKIFLGPHHVARGILIPQPGTEPAPPCMGGMEPQLLGCQGSPPEIQVILFYCAWTKQINIKINHRPLRPFICKSHLWFLQHLSQKFILAIVNSS